MTSVPCHHFGQTSLTPTIWLIHYSQLFDITKVVNDATPWSAHLVGWHLITGLVLEFWPHHLNTGPGFKWRLKTKTVFFWHFGHSKPSPVSESMTPKHSKRGLVWIFKVQPVTCSSSNYKFENPLKANIFIKSWYLYPHYITNKWNSTKKTKLR